MKRYYDNFPLCCPARATLLTGQYAHNHHVLSNSPPDGGYGVFNDLHGDNYLPLWLQTPAIGPPTSASSRTATPSPTSTARSRPTSPSAGTTGMFSPRRARSTSTTRSTRTGACASTPRRPRTTAPRSSPRRRATSSAPTPAPGTPFYLQLGYAAPHGGGGGDPGRSCNRAAVPAPEDLGTLKGKFKGILPPSFNEADISDKPSAVVGQGAADAGSDLRHAAQASLRLGVAPRGRPQHRRRSPTSSRATASTTPPTSSFSPTTASCAASTGSATTSASSTRSRRGCRSSPSVRGSRRARAPTTWLSTPT